MDGGEGLKARLLVGAIAIPIVGLAILSVIAARRSRPTFTSGGELLMRYSLPLRVFGVFAGIVVPLAVYVLLVIFVPKTWTEAYAAAGALLFFLLLGGGLLLETQHVRVTVSDEGIRYHSPWRTDCAYAWDEIDQVSTFSYMYPFGLPQEKWSRS